MKTDIIKCTSWYYKINRYFHQNKMVLQKWQFMTYPAAVTKPVHKIMHPMILLLYSCTILVNIILLMEDLYAHCVTLEITNLISVHISLQLIIFHQSSSTTKSAVYQNGIRMHCGMTSNYIHIAQLWLINIREKWKLAWPCF